jgi:RimJ/RimL family protein N-acetyltransferase
MFTYNEVTLRPFEIEDIDTFYKWDTNAEVNILSGWTPRRSKAQAQQFYEQRILEPPENLETFSILVKEQLTGYAQLALIDREEKRAAVGIVIGERQLWGRGIASTALRILLDYAFTVVGLEKVFAEVYGINTRSLHLMERVGFLKEGVLRQHEIHNGVRQDLHVFGMLKPEFYQRYETLFRLPEDEKV